MSKRPWFPFYTADFLRKTDHLSAEECGCYIRLMRHYWDNNGKLNFNAPQLCRIMGIERRRFNHIWPQLDTFFEHHNSTCGDTLLLPRLQQELEKTIRISKIKAEAGKKGGQAYAQAEKKHKPTHSHSHIKKEHMYDSGESHEFEEIWKARPRRPNESKQKTKKAYNARIREGIPHADLLAGVCRYAVYCKADGVQAKHIKHLSTFLNGDEHWKLPWTVAQKVPETELEIARLVREQNIKLPPNCSLYVARKAISQQTGMAL